MKHNPISNGQDVYCKACGRSWGLDEEMPAECTPPELQRSKLGAYLVGPSNYGANPTLVFAWSLAEAKLVCQVTSGIHVDDLIGVSAPLLDRLCRTTDSCPTFNPRDLATAQSVYAKDIAKWFPGATDVVSLLKLTKKAKP